MKNNATKKALSLLMAALMVFSVLSPLPAGTGLSRAQAADPVPVASWADLKEAVKNGGAIEITENLVADSSITISKDVVITGAGKTIYRKDGNADFPMFSVTNGGKLSLGTGLTLSGQTGTCPSSNCENVDDYKDAVWKGTIANIKPNSASMDSVGSGTTLAQNDTTIPPVTFVIGSDGMLRVEIEKNGTPTVFDVEYKTYNPILRDKGVVPSNEGLIALNEKGERFSYGDTKLVLHAPYWSKSGNKYLNDSLNRVDNYFVLSTNGSWVDSGTWTINGTTYDNIENAKQALRNAGKQVCDNAQAGEFKVAWSNGAATNPKTAEETVSAGNTLSKDPSGWAPEEGYEFKGWKWETPDGQKGTSVGSANPNNTGFSVPSGKYGTMTIVAQWEKPAENGQFNVFRSNGASSNEKTATHENVAVDVALKYTPPADWAPDNGYVFKGWKWIDWNGNDGSSVGSSDPADTGLKVPSNVYGTLTLIAQWEKPAAPSVTAPVASYSSGYNSRIKLGNVTTDLVPVTISYNQGIQYNSPRKDDLSGTFYISTGRDRGLDSADFASANEWWQGFATNAEVATEAQNNGLTPKQGGNGKPVYSPSGLETFPKYQWHVDGQGRLVNGLGWALSTNASGQVIFVNLNGSGGSGGSSGTPTPYTSKNPVAFAKETQGEGEQYESVDPTWSPDTTPAPTPAPTQTCEADGGCKIWKSNEYSSGSVEEPRGFFVKVNQGGTLNITGATLKDFITDASVQNVAPVAVKGGTFSMSGGSIEHNAVGYSANNDYIGRSVDQIEKQVKNVWTRTNTAGAIILTHGSQGNITGGTIQNNRADAGAIIVEGDGTAKKNTGTQTQLGLNGGTISNNFGVHYGGAIYIYNNGLVEMNSGAISNNFAWFKGGAVFASEEVFGSTQWGRPGTTQYVGDAAFVMKGGTLSGNMAVSRAGAIEVMSNHVILVDGDIINNSSRSLGGAIYVEGDGVDRMYTLVLQKGCISNNTAVNNVARPTDLSRVFKGNVATDCNFENILGVPGAGANIYDRGDYGGYYGYGGGIWLCSFGGNATFNINNTFNVIVDGNHSVAGQGEDIQVHVAKGGSPNGVNIVGLGNNSFVNEATGNPLEEGTHYPGKLSIKNTDNRQSCDGCEGVNISGNVASNGGGIAANGTVVFGSDTNVYVPMTKIRLTKSWDEGVTKETITLKYYYKDENGNRVQLKDLDGYQVTFNGKADEKADAPGDDKYTENAPTWEQLNDSLDSFAEMAIPWVVTVNGEKKATFILGLDNPVTINYKDARNNDKTFSGKEFDPSNDEHLAALWTGIRNGVIGGSQLPNGNIVSNQLKIVKWNLEVVETNADGEEINFTLPDGEVANLNVEAHKAQEKVFYDKAAKRLASVNTSVIGFGFNTNILNAKEEEPKVEKYVNDKVHADLEYFDQVFEYSVMAYVPRNATKVVLTDTLRKDLEFVNTAPETVLTSVVVYKDNDSDANTAVGTNQLRNAATVAKNGRSGCPVTVSKDKQTVTLTLDEAFLQTAKDALFGPNGEAKDLDAVWVKMSFKARIKKDSHAALAEKILSGDDTTKDGISWEKVTTNASTIDSNGTAHTEVANGGEHAGMANKANYKVTIKNKGESSYDTNTVTVVPKTEDLTITKKWEGDTANNRPTEDEFKAALKVQSVKGQTVTDLDPQPAATITDHGNNTWTASWTGLPKLEGVTYQVAETKLAGYQNPTGSPAKNGETITNTKEKDTTKVKVTKVWENATEAEKKTAIQVQLKKTVGNADPVNVGDPVTLNGSETTPWTYTWDGLEIEEEGETIIYTVDEVDVPAGFTKIVAKDGTTDYKITNVKATTEKYVDKDVHSDIVNFDKEFVYDILVYVPKDATEFTITDTLVPGLEFADKYGNPSTEVSKVVKEVVWKTTNDHTAGGTVSAKAGGSFNLNTKPDNNGKTNPATIQDSTLTITIDRAAGLSGARGRWVQVTFYARIQNQYRTLDALKKLTGSWTEITNNTPVISQIGSHEGMRNKAEYTVKFGNNGEGTYETNTVTVKPEMVEYKAQKKWQGEDGKEITWPTGAEVRFDLVKITTDNQGQPVEEIVGTKTITSNTTAVFDKQPKLENASYEVREYTEVKSYQIEGSPKKSQDGTEFTFTNRLTDKDFNPAEVTLAASKAMIGADVKDYSGKFKFVLKDGAENVIETKAINKNGKVSFSALRFTKTGTYTYTISELIPDDADKLPNIIYDETVKTIEVKVGKLENAEAVNLVIESVTCNGEPVSFTTKANSSLPAKAPASPYANGVTMAEGNGWVDQGGKEHNTAGFLIKDKDDMSYSETAYCLDFEAEWPWHTGATEYPIDETVVNDGTLDTKFDADKANKIKAILYYGYPNDASGKILNYIKGTTLLSDSGAEWLFSYATNLAIWEITNNGVYTEGGQQKPIDNYARPAAGAAPVNSGQVVGAVVDMIKAEAANGIPSDVIMTTTYYKPGEGFAVYQPFVTVAAQAPQKVTAPVGKFTNIFEQPEIEKYVNKKDATPEQRDGTVHTDLSFFDEVYTYDIQAYVTTDAKYVVVTDQLVEVLQLVNSDSIKIVAKDGAGADGKTAPALSSTAGSVDVKDQCAMDLGTGTANKLVFTFGSEENTEILGFAGQWLQITFDAKIKDEYRSIKALQDKGVNVWNTVTVNDPAEDADCTTEFSGAEAESHEGIINEASYTINKKAGAELGNEWQYEDKSNTVTVEPKTEELKATKAWKNADGSDMTEWPEGAKVTFALMKGEEEVETKTLDKAGTVTFAAQPKLSSVTYKVVEKSVTGIDTLQDGDPTIEGNTWTFTNKKIGVPEIEKYINQNVHEFINKDDEFTYDIIAYVTGDADKVIITDELNSQLTFVGEAADVKVYDLGTSNNHNTADKAKEAGGTATVATGTAITTAAVTINGQKLEVVIDNQVSVDAEAGTITRAKDDVTKLRGHYVRVEFKAALTDAAKADLSTLKLEEIKENAPLNVTDAQKEHEGVANKASYKIEVGNEGKYEDESNTVTVKPEEPEIEKYINQNVHEFINKDDEFTYDIIAYVTGDADKVIITDELNSQLTFVGEAADVKVYDLGTANNHNTADKAKEAGGTATVATGTAITTAAVTINGQKLEVVIDNQVSVDTEAGTITRAKDDVTKLRGHYVRVEFKAALTDEAKADLSTLKLEEIKENAPLNVTDAQKEHEGVANKASYKIEVGNEGKYEDESNTVTVKPEEPEIEKYINQNVHEFINKDDEFTYDIIAYVTEDADKVIITDELNSQLTFVGEAADVKVYDLGTSNNHNTADKAKEAGGTATVATGTAITTAAVTINGQKLEVVIDNQVSVDAEAGTITRAKDDVTKLRGHYVRVEFKAVLTDVAKADLSTLKLEEIKENAPLNVTDAQKEHEGVANKASYKIEVGNEGKYEDESNTVTVKPEEPEIEKYVNKKSATGTAKDGGVHTDLAAFNEVYTYDIQAYIAKDATVAEITDELKVVLEFVGEAPTAVVIKAGEEGGKAPKLSKAGAAPQDAWSIDKDAWKEGKLVLTLGKADSTEVLKAAGQWIQITFEAKIKDTFKSIDALKNAGADVWTTVVENDPIDDAKVDNDFSGAKVDSHEGIANDTSYRMKKAGVDVDNTWSYNDKSNTVTVQPKTTKLTVSKEWKTGTLVDQWPEGATVEVKLTQTKDGVTTEVEGKTDKLTASKTTVIFADLPCLEGVTYGVAEGKVTNAGEYKIGEVKKVSEGVFKITNQREEEPEIEKYVNKKSASGTAKDGGVHTDLAAFYEVYTYDIQAYIAKDATVAEITDELKAVLEFVGNGPTAVVIKAGEAYGKAPKLSKAGTAPKDAWSIDQEAWKAGKLVLTLGKADSTEVLKAAGQWIQITFDARIKDSFKSIDALKKAGTDVWQTIVENDPIDDAKVDNAFSGAKVDKHEGIANDTSYRMKKAGVDVGNTWSYNDKSNTVTVQPKTVKVSVNKIWIGKPADALRLALRRDGVIIETVTISAGSKWSYEWKSLPAGYKYEVTESVPANFTQTGSDTQVDKDGNVTVSLENTRTTTVKINKTDLGGTELAGAVIEVKDANGEVIATWTSEVGKTMDLNLVPGEYTFREVNAPEGYECVTTEIGFTVNGDGTVTVTTTTVEPAGAVEVIDGVIVLLDKVKEFPVKINKTDLGGTELAGAVIEVKDANGEVIATWTSEVGKTMDLNLVPGEYTFREVNAPEGYECVTTEIGFTVNGDGTVTVTTTTVEPAGAVEVIDGVIILKDELKKEEPTTETEEEETDETEPDDGGSLPPGDEDESTTVNAETESPSTEPETEPEGSLPPSDDEETTTVNAETSVPNTPPDTGDHSNLGLYIGLIAAAGVAGVGLLLATRKKKEEE